MDHPLYNMQHQQVGSLALPEDVFGVAESPELLNLIVKAQRASRRAGTHATRTRAQVRGGGAKPHKQKGSGRARQGSSRAPNHVGGGVVFGPHPRDYSYRPPRSARRKALRVALSTRLREGQLVLIDELALDRPQTRTMATFLAGGQGGSALVVDQDNLVLARSMRNLPRSRYLAAEAINVYDILRHERLVLTRGAIEQVVAKSTATGKGARGEGAAS